MKISKIENVERKNVLLEKDVDFEVSDLKDGMNGTKVLSQEWKEKWITNNYEFGKIVWMGFLDRKTSTIKIQVEKELYI